MKISTNKIIRVMLALVIVAGIAQISLAKSRIRTLNIEASYLQKQGSEVVYGFSSGNYHFKKTEFFKYFSSLQNAEGAKIKVRLLSGNPAAQWDTYKVKILRVQKAKVVPQ